MSRVRSPSPTPNIPSLASFFRKFVVFAKHFGGSDYHGEMIPIQCRGVLFDLDGVLVDSTPAVARAWAWWAREHGFDPDEVVKKAHGRPRITTIRELLPHADHPAEVREMDQPEIPAIDAPIPF